MDALPPALPSFASVARKPLGLLGSIDLPLMAHTVARSPMHSHRGTSWVLFNPQLAWQPQVSSGSNVSNEGSVWASLADSLFVSSSAGFQHTQL